VEHQRGTKGFTISKRKAFVLQEAEMSAEVIRRIEGREAAIERLKAASQRVYKSYIEDVSSSIDHSKLIGRKVADDSSVHSTGSYNKNDSIKIDDGGGSMKVKESMTEEGFHGIGSTVGGKTGGGYDFMNNLEICMKDVRLKSIECVEALGAWARICKKEERKKQEYLDNGGGLIPLYEHSVDTKRYCVVIAAKGKPLYAQSQAMKSNSKRFTRGVELEKNSIEMRHIGVFDTW
jgi:hypothetical protein